MDYKYIEQLLECYWNCETSEEEEQILHAFFRQKEIPAHLLRYKSLFAYHESEKEICLGEDFDATILAQVEKPTVKAGKLTMRMRFMPLFRAAAMIAGLLTVGTLMQRSMEGSGEECGIPMCEGCGDSASDAQVAAYESVYSTDTVPKIAVDETASGQTN